MILVMFRLKVIMMYIIGPRNCLRLTLKWPVLLSGSSSRTMVCSTVTRCTASWTWWQHWMHTLSSTWFLPSLSLWKIQSWNGAVAGTLHKGMFDNYTILSTIQLVFSLISHLGKCDILRLRMLQCCDCCQLCNPCLSNSVAVLGHISFPVPAGMAILELHTWVLLIFSKWCP